jgi:hypothetical protein
MPLRAGLSSAGLCDGVRIAKGGGGGGGPVKPAAPAPPPAPPPPAPRRYTAESTCRVDQHNHATHVFIIIIIICHLQHMPQGIVTVVFIFVFVQHTHTPTWVLSLLRHSFFFSRTKLFTKCRGNFKLVLMLAQRAQQSAVVFSFFFPPHR